MQQQQKQQKWHTTKMVLRAEYKLLYTKSTTCLDQENDEGEKRYFTIIINLRRGVLTSQYIYIYVYIIYILRPLLCNIINNKDTIKCDTG